MPSERRPSNRGASRPDLVRSITCSFARQAGKEWPSRRRVIRQSHPKLDLEDLSRLSRAELRGLWERELGDKPPATLGRDILALAIAYERQERLHGGLTRPVARELGRLFDRALLDGAAKGPQGALATSLPRAGTILVREWQGAAHHVTVVTNGFLWNGQTYRSLFVIAHAITGTKWNGPRFFGMREGDRKILETSL
jgi:Protein of unknown function (DUF2924)